MAATPPAVRPEENASRARGLLHDGRHRPTPEELRAAFDRSASAPDAQQVTAELAVILAGLDARDMLVTDRGMSYLRSGPEGIVRYVTADGYRFTVRVTGGYR